MKNIIFFIPFIFSSFLITTAIEYSPTSMEFNQCETFLYNSGFNDQDFDNYDKYNLDLKLFIWEKQNKILFRDKHSSTEYNDVRIRKLRFSTEFYLSDSLYYNLCGGVLIEYKITPHIYSKKIFKKVGQ